jgi:hypothetical protein
MDCLDTSGRIVVQSEWFAGFASRLRRTKSEALAKDGMAV